MGKRSNFQKIGRDLYETWDPRAIPPLLPHLPKGKRFAEPCAASGALVRQLEPHLPCAWASDIVPLAAGIVENDALTCGLGDADIFITNPPWTRKILHPLIVHLSDLAPTFLLFQSNWANTQQAQPFLNRCRRIIAVGRLKWIPDTPHDHMEDVSWYLFDKPIPGSNPIFFGRDCPPMQTSRRVLRKCFDCGHAITQRCKWELAVRDGITTTVHRHCDNPGSYYAKGAEPIAPAPLFDWTPA